MNLRTRLTILFSILCSAILFLSFWVIYAYSEAFLKSEYERRLRDKAITTAILLLKVDAVDSTLLKTIDRAKRDNLYLENISILDKSNKEIYTNNDSVHFNLDYTILRSIRESKTSFFRYGDFDVVGMTYTHKGNDYIVLAGAVDLQRPKRLNELRNLLISLLIVLVTVVAIIGWVYAGRALKPIQKVIQQVEGLSTTKLSERLTESATQDEIGSLISIFNKLLNRIESAFLLQKTFVANVSHELKNPLTKITSQLEVTSLKERSPAEYQEIIQSVLEDVKELNQLSNSLLDLATLNEDYRSFTMSKIRLDEIIWDAREKILTVNPDYEIDFSIAKMPEEETQMMVEGNPYLLRTAFINLIENACKFSYEKKADISLLVSDGEINVRVINRGPGIPIESVEKVLQPFYRSNNTSKVKGYGIGLPLAEKIIAIHKGSLEIESIPGETTVVSVSLKAIVNF
jgi:signal transduction histidine kinase